ncbi:MAG: transporter, partial [Paenibacillaceae bacterium]|nr:transporter [Paenibacillaceae bacterium]
MVLQNNSRWWVLFSLSLGLMAVSLDTTVLRRKQLLLGALLLFGAASASCAAASTPGMLIGMRAFLGLGAAFLIPLSISVLPVLFKGEERTRAMMIWMTVNMLGIPLGPLLGGYLLKHYHWSAVFLINLPLIAIAIIAVALLMPESHSEHRPKPDPAGVILSSSGLAAVTYGFIRSGEQGWGDSAAWLAIAGGILLLIVLFLWECRA